MNQGNYREALKKGTIEIGKQIVKQGPRVIQPIAQTTAAGLRTLGAFAEADGLIFAAGELGMKASLLEASGALAAGWEAILAGTGTVVAAAEIIIPLCAIALGITFIMAITSKPASAAALKMQYDSLNRELRDYRHKNKPGWQLPKPGRAG